MYRIASYFRGVYISREHSQSSKIKIINVDEVRFRISITFREQELNWLFAKYMYKRPENNPLYSRTSIIRHGNSLKKNFLSLKMGVSAAFTMDTGIFIFCACADAHIHCCLSIKWVDQGVVSIIRLSGMAKVSR